MTLLLFSCFGLIFCRSFPFPCVLCLSICCEAGLVVLNSLNFCLSGKLLISPSNLNESHGGQSSLDFRFFPFITLNILCHSLLACRVSVEKSTDSLMGNIPLNIICHFPLVVFNILSLSLIFISLITMCFGVFLLGFIHPRLSVLPGLGWLFPVPCQGSFQLLSLQYFLRSFLGLFFWDPYMQMLVCLILSQGSLSLSSFLFTLFSTFCSAAVISTILSSRLGFLSGSDCEESTCNVGDLGSIPGL